MFGGKSSSFFRLREPLEDEALKGISVLGQNKPVPVFVHLYKYCCSIGDSLAFDVRPNLSVPSANQWQWCSVLRSRMPLKPPNGRRRVVIEDVNPQIDAGRHQICRVAGDEVVVTAAIFADGKDELAARLLYRHSSDRRWSFVPMRRGGQRFLERQRSVVDKLGGWRFTLLGWVDHFATWAGELKKRIAAQNDPQTSDGAPGAVAGSECGAECRVQFRRAGCCACASLRRCADRGGRAAGASE